MLGMPVAVAIGAALALALSLLTLGVGWAHWRRGATPAPFGLGLEVLCAVVNVGALVFAYREAVSGALAAAAPHFVRVHLAVEVFLEGVAWLVPLTLLLPSLAAVAIAVCWSGRLRRAQAAPRTAWLALALALFVLGGVVPFATGLGAYARRVQPEPPHQRVAAAEQARAELERRAAIAALAMLGAAIALVGSLRRRAVQSHWLRTTVPTLLFGGGAAALFWHARPLAAENGRPVPIDRSFVNASLAIPSRIGSTGVGPDEVVEAPWILLEGESIVMDGLRLDDGRTLQDVLGRKRELWQSVHPTEQRFPGEVVVDVWPDVPTTLLAERLERIRASGHPQVRFLLTELHREKRPILGELVGVSRSAVAVTLAASKADCGAPPFAPQRLAWMPSRPSKALIDALVAERRAGKRPCIITVEPHCDGDPADCAAPAFELTATAAHAGVDAVHVRAAGVELDLLFFSDETPIAVYGRELTLADVERELEAEAMRLLFAAPLPRAMGSLETIDAYVLMSAATGARLIEEARVVVAPLPAGKSLRAAAGVDTDRSLLVFGIATQPLSRHDLATSLLAAGCNTAVELASGALAVELPALERHAERQARGPFVAVIEPGR